MQIGVLPDGVKAPEWFLEILRIDVSDCSEEEKRLFNKALVTSYKYDSVTYRKSGETYIVHDWRCALRALKAGLGLTMATALLIHELIEDNGWSKRRIKRHFGKKIADMVYAVSKWPKTMFINRQARLTEHIRRWIRWALIIWQVLFMKLIDRVDNTHDTGKLTEEERDRLFWETEVYFIPKFEKYRYLIPDEFKRVYDVLLLELKITCGNHISAKMRENIATKRFYVATYTDESQLSLPLV